jgi:dUTP pyrophosphatase
MKKKINIKYFVETLKRLEYIGGKSDWIDLRCAKDMKLKAGEFALIPLGVAMQLPKGYEALVVPRSSTFKTWGIIQTNSMGVIDETYCGEKDQWFMPVYATRDVVININDRVCQFRIIKHQPTIKFITDRWIKRKDRGGHGSTGKN